MQRRDFIAQLGLGAAFALTTSCFSSCKKEDEVKPQNVDFTLDLTDAANSALLTNGGFVVRNDVVIAKTLGGQYVAATLICSHQQNKKIFFSGSANEWQCAEHGARFNLTGGGLNDEGSRGLRIYQTALTGNSLRIF
jgi:cytochrome b6-f complex iron-sulfur subunit